MKKIFGYKKVLICAAAILLTACSSDASYKDLEKNAENVAKHVSDQIENQKDANNENVLGVKNGYPRAYPNCKFGDVFGEFFSDPTWQYFKSTDDRDVVEFTGYCIYREQEVKVRLQFILADDSFEFGALSINDVPQDNSDRRYLTADDVYEVDGGAVRFGLNEIYARHGRKFNDPELQNYFNSQPWYTPVYTPDEFNAIENSVFNEYEKANVKFLADLIR